MRMGKVTMEKGDMTAAHGSEHQGGIKVTIDHM